MNISTQHVVLSKAILVLYIRTHLLHWLTYRSMKNPILLKNHQKFQLLSGRKIPKLHHTTTDFFCLHRSIVILLPQFYLADTPSIHVPTCPFATTLRNHLWYEMKIVHTIDTKVDLTLTVMFLPKHFL